MPSPASDKRQKRRVASDEAHSWARNLRLGNPHAKSVLRAIAVYCNDEGRCMVGMPTLALDCDVSIDTVRSRLRFLEEVGAIALFPCWRDSLGRRNYEKNGKRTTDDIVLLIEADPSEIEARARGEVPADDDANQAQNEHADDEFSPGQGQGLNDDAANRSHGLALGQSLDSAKDIDSSNLEPDTSPQPPSGGRSIDASHEREAELFAYFRAHYPDRELWAWEKAAPIFAAMPRADQERAAASSPDYAKKIILTKRKPPPVKPERFMKDRLFDNFPDSKLPEKPKPELPRVFYPVDSDEFRALKVANALAGQQLRWEWGGDNNVVKGVWRRAEIEPALLALAPMADVAIETLPHVAIEGSHEWGAWKGKLRSWIGFEPEPRKIFTEPHNPAIHDLPFSHPDHKFRKSMSGIRVPWPFPPLKDGTISR